MDDCAVAWGETQAIGKVVREAPLRDGDDDGDGGDDDDGNDGTAVSRSGGFFMYRSS